MAQNGRALERLPSLPQVLLRLLDAMHSEKADLQTIADIVRHDTAMAARLLEVANSSYYGRSQGCQTIERALLLLGTNTVKTLVITASMTQFFSRFNPHHQPFIKAFWRRSLIAANFAQVLASLTRYPAPDEAYLSALLMDVGQLLLLSRHDQRYLDIWSAAINDRALIEAERTSFQQAHTDVGADLVDGWKLPGFSGDAIRYHHEPSAQLLDAHHLVKIINLASLCSAPDSLSDEALAQADDLFGLNAALTRELRTRIEGDVARIAGGLNIDISGDDNRDQTTTQQLSERLKQLTQLSQLNGELWREQSRSALEQSIRRIVFLTLGIEHCVLFVADENRSSIAAYTNIAALENNTAATADFVIPLLPQRSLITDALLQRESVHTATRDASSFAVIDKQVLKLCKTEHILCLPLVRDEQPIGVLVLGLNTADNNPRISKPVLVAGLCDELAGAIKHHQQQMQNAGAAANGNGELQTKIREAVHEASNPLSIISNYLEMLRLKLGEGNQVQGDISVIKQEIDRVGVILLRLREPDVVEANDGQVELNKLVSDLARIFEQSLCMTKQIKLQLKLAENMPVVQSNVTHLQQILTNLIKNAIEALPPGGNIIVSTEYGTVVNGRVFARISVADNGPGIAEPVLRQLFSPVTSTKGAGHSGIGLSIVKKLVDEIRGSIHCKSSKVGTEFQVFIPVE